MAHVLLREPTQNFGQKMQKKFLVEKASLSMGEMRPKILGAMITRNPRKGGQRGGDDRDWPWFSPI